MKKISLILFAIFLPICAMAKPDAAIIDKAEKYLNSITGMTGNFVQTANGKKQTGIFSMLRPGRVRLDYKTSPIQLISDGTDLYFFDKSLDQITTVPMTSTPAGILVRKNINLKTADIVVSDTQSNDKTFSLKMHMKDNAGLGNMTVVFDNNPIKLNSWTVVDATGAKTSVAFSGLKEKTDFEKNYFQIKRHKTISTSGGDSYYE